MGWAKQYCRKGGVLAGNGRASARPTIHPPDRTAAQLLDGKGPGFAVRRVIPTLVGHTIDHRFSYARRTVLERSRTRTHRQTD